MGELIRIKIEDRVYPCQRFNPMDGMEYGAKIAGLIAPVFTSLSGDNTKDGIAALSTLSRDPLLTPMLKQALGQCFTPQNESLGNEAVFNSWFQKHPGDMFELGIKAVWALVEDFLPSPLAMTAKGLQEKLSHATQTSA